MASSFARFEKLSTPMQSLVIAAITSPVFAIFSMLGDLPRGALAWTFLGALMITFNAQRENSHLGELLLPAGLLLTLHLPLIVCNPLKHAPFFGGFIQPIIMVDGCIDYAFLWLWLKIFRN